MERAKDPPVDLTPIHPRLSYAAARDALKDVVDPSMFAVTFISCSSFLKWRTIRAIKRRNRAMKSAKKVFGQVRALCRCYPAQITAHEIVGKTYLILDKEPEIPQKTVFLADHLSPKELAKLIAAAREVFTAYDSFSAVDGFKLGAVVFASEKDSSSIAVDDRLVPGKFVKQLLHCAPAATERSA
jgi:hypothetical protein